MKNLMALKSSYALSNFFFFLNAWNLSSWSSSSIKDATIGIEERSYRSNLNIYIYIYILHGTRIHGARVP